MKEKLALIDFNNPCVFHVVILHTTFCFSFLLNKIQINSCSCSSEQEFFLENVAANPESY